jgi:hypothetical protein
MWFRTSLNALTTAQRTSALDLLFHIKSPPTGNIQMTELFNSLTPHNVCSTYCPSQHGDRCGVRAGTCCVQHLEHSLWHTNGLRYVWTAVVRGRPIRTEPLLLRVPGGPLHVSPLAYPKTDTRLRGCCCKHRYVRGSALN